MRRPRNKDSKQENKNIEKELINQEKQTKTDYKVFWFLRMYKQLKP